MFNLRRIGLFLLTNFLVMITIGIAFNIVMEFLGRQGFTGYTLTVMIMALLWGMGGAFISLLISKWMAKKSLGVRTLEAQTPIESERWLLDTVAHIAQTAGLPAMPEVGIYPSAEMNAFATGPSRRNSLVAVSTGLMTKMNRSEIEGVLAHEVAHISNGDMVTMTLVQGVVNSFVLFFSRILANIVSQNVGERNRPMLRFALSMVFDLVFGLLGSIVVCYVSRQREFRADAGSARFVGPDKMIQGLRRLQTQVGMLPTDSTSMATLKITNRPQGFLGALFRTHPSLDERIARLSSSAVVR